MEISIKILWPFLFPLMLAASETKSDISHPFYLLKSGDSQVRVQTGYFTEEHEYEKGQSLQDLFEYQHFTHQFGSIWGIPGSRQLGLNVSFQTNGKLYKEYSPALNIARHSLEYRGFHAMEIFFQEHLETNNEKNKLALEIRLKGSPVKGKETNNTYAGKDIALSFLYSHKHQEWRIYGDLQAEIIGRKRITKYDGESEIINAYSQFGNLLGLQWLQDKFWLESNVLFYLTTDYNSTSPSYTRLTDKGFVTSGKILLGYYLSSKSYLTLEHVGQGATFNVISESTSDPTAFEIESQLTQVGVTWLF